MAKKDFTLGQGLGNLNPTNLAAGMNNQRWGKVIYVSPSMIIPNPKNKYEIVDIDDLADNIAVFGVLQPLLVKGPFPDKTYMLLGGERRWTAINKVLQTDPEGAKKLANIPIVVYGPANMDEVDEEIIIRETNRLVRDMNKYNVQDIWELNDLYKKKRERGDDVPENIIKHIAEKMGIGVRQTQKIISIDEHMIPEMKDKIGENGLTINKASKIAHLPKEKQEEIHKIMKEQGKIDMETIQEIERRDEQDTYIDIPVPDKDDIPEEVFLNTTNHSADIEEENSIEDSVTVVSDSSENFYETTRQIAKENREKEFIGKILGWMQNINAQDRLEVYQRDAIERIQELSNSILA